MPFRSVPASAGRCVACFVRASFSGGIVLSTRSSQLASRLHVLSERYQREQLQTHHSHLSRNRPSIGAQLRRGMRFAATVSNGPPGPVFDSALASFENSFNDVFEVRSGESSSSSSNPNRAKSFIAVAASDTHDVDISVSVIPDASFQTPAPVGSVRVPASTASSLRSDLLSGSPLRLLDGDALGTSRVDTDALVGAEGLVARPRQSGALRQSPPNSTEVADAEETPSPLGHLSRVERRVAAADKRVETLAKNPDMIAMHPERLGVQQDLLEARSAGRLLALCSPAEVEAMDPINLATAIYRLAKFMSAGEKHSIVTTVRFAGLLEATELNLESLKPQGLVNVLWALVSLETSPTWMPRLLALCHERRDHFTVRDLSAVLACLAKAPSVESACPEAVLLRTGAIDAVRQRICDLTTPTDLVCVAATLTRLQQRDEELYAGIAEQALRVLEICTLSDLSSLLWAFASVQLFHSQLFNRVREALQTQIERCDCRELVQASWAFSRVSMANAQLLSGVFAPAIRAKLLEFEGPRDLCTIAWSFSNAKVVDRELFNDIAHALSPKVRLMNAHDVSSVVVALVSVEFAHKRLFKALQKQTRSIVHSLSPLQLARTIYGFGLAGAEDEHLFRQLCEQVVKQRHLLHAKNIVEIMIGLAEAEYMPEKVVADLMRDAQVYVRWLGADDLIHVMHALSRMPADRRSKCAPVTAAVACFLSALHQRAHRRLRYQPAEAADLVEVLHALDICDPSLLESVCLQLPRLFKNADCVPSVFLRLWGALAELRARSDEGGGGRDVVKEHLHRHGRLRDPLEARLLEASQMLESSKQSPAKEAQTQRLPSAIASLRPLALLAYACARLGYDGNAACQLLDDICTILRSSDVRSLTVEPTVPLLVWALTELNHEQRLAKACLEAFLQGRYEPRSGLVGGAEHLTLSTLMHLAWTCLALEMPLRPELLAELQKAAESHSPSDRLSGDLLELANTVAVACVINGYSQSSMGPILCFLERGESFGKGAQARKSSNKSKSPARGNYDELGSLVSEALIRLRVPHESAFLVPAGTTTIASGRSFRGSLGSRVCLGITVLAALPQRKIALDLRGPAQLGVASKAPLGSARLRQRQLEALGWRCTILDLAAIKRAVEENRLDHFLTEVIANCDGEGTGLPTSEA